MNYIKLSLFFLLFCLGTSCSRKNSDTENGVPISHINYLSLSRNDLENCELLKEVDYILLKDTGERAVFGRTDKVKIINDYIYILDRRLLILAVYDNEGHFVTTVGDKGQGPGEYVNMTDFDVDSIGNICLLDGRLDKILFYDSKFRFVHEKKLPFEADILQFLDRKHLMFGLSAWNKGENEGRKIILTDMNLNIINSYFQYDKYVDPAFWISGYQFAKSKYNIAYNQTINNDIYVFDHVGQLKEIIHFDFGDKNVPNESKIDIESKLNNFDDYYVIKKIYTVSDNCIVGTIWENRNTKIFVIDRSLNSLYIGGKVSDLDHDFLCGACEQGIISNIIAPNDAYPDSVNRHLELEGAILKIQTID